ncbi:TlpA family protein disulfide reductase [Croceitalea rosinachiae]|uniref:Thioredoxin family protein n=1 Tax=Croceitalea rosinachiae TaxID=3075596 RepID=A0ABU3AAF1_9FLAO|nr:thioredoxin family protein [Croceitalea sp. F388]MDT0606885.1 thioredoxin family protein [Croceitalea sp. F388]
MKSGILLLLALSINLCAAQEFNQEINTQNGHQFLVGPITLEGLQNEPYKGWFDSSYNSYMVDKSLTKMMKKQLKNYDLKLFLGTWCGDSKREMPRIIKILQEAKFPMENLEIIALDRRKEFYKKSPGGEEKGLNIIKVPTLIFFKDGKQVNRIVESPIASLEEDILSILKGTSYIPNYSK